MIIVDGRRPAMSDEASEKRGREEERKSTSFCLGAISSSGRYKEERHPGG